MSKALYEQAKALASQLTPTQQIRLLGWLEATVEMELPKEGQPSKPTHFSDLFGTWHDVHVTDEDIEEVRRESLSNFPHDDI